MKNLVPVLLLILFFISFKNYSQETENGILWLTVTSEDTKPINDSITDNSTINSIFSQFGVYSFKQAFPFAKTPELLDIYEILCTGDQQQLKLELEQNATELLIKIKELEVPQLLFDPLDYFWQLQINNNPHNWMWHLQKTEANLAWDITKGSEQIKIAVIDSKPDIEHPDLKTEIYPHYDPYSLRPYFAYTNFNYHGTAVCSFAAAETQEFEPSDSDKPLCSMGFISKIISYSNLEGIKKALHASTVLNVDVITISWFTSCSRDVTGYDSTIIKEILDNGTVIVAAAGNGFCKGCYNDSLIVSNCDSIPEDFEHFSTLYPFSENYDDRIITVTGTDSLDFFTYYAINSSSDTFNATHSYFPGVDVCAPGHHIMGAAPTLRKVGDSIFQNPWPFSGGCGGTSYATPIVAGLAALIKSINPCFSPEEVQYFIKSTTDTITDGYLYLDEYGNSQTGTGRINAYSAVSLAQQYSNNIDIHIHHNETWTNDTTVNSIFIHPGGQLTIKSNVVFNNITSGIIVDRGGKLIVEGGHLNSCGSIWKGIEVWGNPDTTQNFSGLQGYAELKDSTIIEDAEYGIVAYKIGDEDMIYTGGIIRAENTFFINNIQCLEFHPYQNIHPYYPSYEFDNLSSFNNCSFIINNPKVYYYHTDFTITEQWKAFIKLQGVKGINVNGCYFYNNINETTPNDTNIKMDDFYTGILSFASGFSVDELCLVPYYPCASSKTTKFDRLKYGIRAFSLGKQKAVYVRNSEFTSCKTGVYLSGINNPVITSNVFELINVDTTDLGNNPCLNKTGIFGGIYLDACSGYKIEENEINVTTGPFAQQMNSIGIVINNSGEEYNEIYNNQIENLYVSILAQNNNRGDSLGLCLKCNDLKKNKYDIAVTLDTNLRGWGIAQYQGSPENVITAPANNSFSTGTADYSDIYNDGEGIIYYHTYNQLGQKLRPEYYTTETVSLSLNPQQYSKDSSCPSSFGSGIDPGAIESKIIESETIITNKNSELNSLVDGGNTEELNTDVQISIPPEAMQVRQQLMNESPYLSDTVMKSAIDKENVLPNAMIRDVLVANPQSAKSDNVIEALDERYIPMPDYMMTQIMQGKNTASAKENLEAEIQNWKGKNEKAYNNIIRYYKNDTTLTSFDSVIYWLQTKNTIDARYRLAFEHLSNNDISLVNNVLSGITDDFVLNTNQSIIHQDYLSYFQIMNALVSQGKTILEADSAQIVSLQSLANNDNYLPGIYARNSLIALAKINYQEPYILPNPLKTTDVDYYPLPELEKINYLKIFPNPARDYIVVEYNTDIENYLIDNGQQNIILRFTDINGKLIRVQHLNRAKDQLVVNTKTFNTGVYICNLFVDGKLIDTSKFTIY